MIPNQRYRSHIVGAVLGAAVSVFLLVSEPDGVDIAFSCLLLAGALYQAVLYGAGWQADKHKQSLS